MKLLRASRKVFSTKMEDMIVFAVNEVRFAIAASAVEEITRKFGENSEWTAVPVSGACELTRGELLPRCPGLPEYVTGLLDISAEMVEVLDLKKLASAGVTA